MKPVCAEMQKSVFYKGVYMKRIVFCILCPVILLLTASCGISEETYQTEKTVAVKYESADEFAVDEYVSDGFIAVTYNSTADVVLAVENGKADFGILNEFDYNLYRESEREIQIKEKCSYTTEYCAYMNFSDEELAEQFNGAITELKSNGTLEKIINGTEIFVNGDSGENGTLTMLCDPSFENRIYADSDGNVTGIDVTIASEICRELGYKTEIVTGDFDELFLMLQDGEGDFIITASEFTQERSEYFLASDSYLTLNYFLIEKSE